MLKVNEEKITVFIVDKDFNTLKSYEELMQKIMSKAKIKYFTHCSDLEKSMQKDTPAIVILDAEEKLGMITANKIKESNNNIKIIISAESDRFALESMQKGYSGYIKKPFTEESIKKQLEMI